MKIQFSNGQVWPAAVLDIRDAWDGIGYRCYWATPDDEQRYGVQVDGEINGKRYTTIRLAVAAMRRRYPNERIFRNGRELTAEVN